MKKTNLNNTTPTANTILLYAEKATNHVLKNRYDKSAVTFLNTLNKSRGQDFTSMHVETWERMQELYIKRLALYKSYKLHEKEYKRTTISNKLRIEEYEKYCEKKRKYNLVSTELQGLEKKLSTTLSERADIVQNACLGIWEYLTNLEQEESEEESEEVKNISKINEMDWHDLTTTIENFDRDIWRIACKHANRGISQLANPDALNGYKTKTERATEEQTLQFISDYRLFYEDCKFINNIQKEVINGITAPLTYYRNWLDIEETRKTIAKFKLPLNRKNTKASELYLTLEYKNYKGNIKEKGKDTGIPKRGWYFIKHYKYGNYYRYIQDLTEEGQEVDPIYLVKVSEEQEDSLQKLQDLAKHLTDREQFFIKTFLEAVQAVEPKETFKEYQRAKEETFIIMKKTLGTPNNKEFRKKFLQRLSQKVRELVKEQRQERKKDFVRPAPKQARAKARPNPNTNRYNRQLDRSNIKPLPKAAQWTTYKGKILTYGEVAKLRNQYIKLWFKLLKEQDNNKH